MQKARLYSPILAFRVNKKASYYKRPFCCARRMHPDDAWLAQRNDGNAVANPDVDGHSLREKEGNAVDLNLGHIGLGGVAFLDVGRFNLRRIARLFVFRRFDGGRRRPFFGKVDVGQLVGDGIVRPGVMPFGQRLGFALRIQRRISVNADVLLGEAVLVLAPRGTTDGTLDLPRNPGLGLANNFGRRAEAVLAVRALQRIAFGRHQRKLLLGKDSRVNAPELLFGKSVDVVRVMRALHHIVIGAVIGEEQAQNLGVFSPTAFAVELLRRHPFGTKRIDLAVEAEVPGGRLLLLGLCRRFNLGDRALLFRAGTVTLAILGLILLCHDILHFFAQMSKFVVNKIICNIIIP